MRLGTTVALGGDVSKFARQVRDLEAAGIDVFWTGEAYTADAVSTMGFLAAITEQATIGSGVLPSYSRTPTLLAMTGLGLHKLTSGRVILGIGASGPQVIEGFHGIPYDDPVERTREIVDICRQVWRGHKVEHHGRRYRIPLPPDEGTGLGKALRVRDDALPLQVPVYVASLGPKNVAMTAEIADGWLPIHYWPEKAADVWARALAEGSAKRSPELSPLEIVAGGPLAITDDPTPLRDASRPRLAFFFGGMGARSKNFYNDLLQRYGYEAEAAAIQDAWRNGDHRTATASVPDALVEGLTLAGPESWVRERVEVHRASGVTVLNVDPIGPDRLHDVERVKEWIS